MSNNALLKNENGCVRGKLIPKILNTNYKVRF